MKRRKLFQMIGALAAVLPLTAGARARSGRRLCVLDASIAGFAHYDGEQCLPYMAAGDPLTLQRQPDNAHDHRAIEIFWNGHKIGYVPRAHNRALCRLMDAGEVVVGEVKRVDTWHWERIYFAANVVV
jgi:hypothetical protein